MAETVNFAPDWFDKGPLEYAEAEVNSALAAIDASIQAITSLEITVVDTSMYFTPDGSTTQYSWKVTVV